MSPEEFAEFQNAASHMFETISVFAEKYGKYIKNKDTTPLTPEQKAWCESKIAEFEQIMKNLDVNWP